MTTSVKSNDIHIIYLIPFHAVLVVLLQLHLWMVFPEVNCDLAAIPIQSPLPAAGHPAVERPLAPGRVVRQVPLLVDLDRHPSQLVVVPELGTVGKVVYLGPI